MNGPSFSICIPNYNYGRYIGDTIQSVLAQTYQNFEIIVADNASTDNSVDVVESFQDARIRLVRNRYNIGFAPNLQRATMFARNDFINMISSDDQMKPRALETYARIIKELGDKAQRAVLYSPVETFDPQGRITHIIRKAADGFYNEWVQGNELVADRPSAGAEAGYMVYSGREVLKDSLARLRIFGLFLSTVYPRSLWEQVEGYNSVRTIGPDKHFAYKLLSQDPIVVYVPQILYRYRDYQSDNRAVQFSTLKQMIDDYLYTLEFSDDYLKSLGLSKDQLIHTFLNRVCLKEGLSQLGRGSYSNAFRLWAFALASYPGKAFRLTKTYQLGALLSLGPLSPKVASFLYRTRQQRVGDHSSSTSAALESHDA